MSVDDLSIGLRATIGVEQLGSVTDGLQAEHLRAPVASQRLDTIKFASCVPDEALEVMVAARDADVEGVVTALGEPMNSGVEA